MYWVIPALFTAFLIGLYNLNLEGIGKQTGSDYVTKNVIIMTILIISGFFSAIVVGVIRYINPSSTRKGYNIINKNKNLILGSAGLLVLQMIMIIYALSSGGAIAMAIINLNLFVTLIGGALLYEDKLNFNIVLSLIGTVILTGYASYESYLLENNK